MHIHKYPKRLLNRHENFSLMSTADVGWRGERDESEFGDPTSMAFLSVAGYRADAGAYSGLRACACVRPARVERPPTPHVGYIL